MKRGGKLLALAFVFSSATVAKAGDGELHSFHCLFGCPLGVPSTNDTIVREIYTLSSNDLTKIADWVEASMPRSAARRRHRLCPLHPSFLLNSEWHGSP